MDASELSQGLEELGNLLKRIKEGLVRPARVLEDPKPEGDEYPAVRLEPLVKGEELMTALDLTSLKGGEFSSVASLDSSSRSLGSSVAHIVLSGGSAYSTSRGLITFPFDASGVPFALASYLDGLRQIAGSLTSPLVTLKNRAEYEYALDEVEVVDRTGSVTLDSLYDVNDIGDELRLSAENVLLDYLKDDLVVLDGPIIPTPVEVVTDLTMTVPVKREELNHWGKMTHRWSMAYIIKDRVEAVKGKRVVGVVKRLDQSFKLSKVPEVLRMLGVGRARLSDSAVLELLSERYCNVPFTACFLGPFRMSSHVRVEREDRGEVILDSVPDRFVGYVVLNVGVRSFFRVEAMEERLLFDALGEVFGRVSGNGLPTLIDVVDRHSKLVAKGLFLFAFQHLRDYVTFLHDTKLEALAVQEEVSRGLSLTLQAGQ